MDSEKTGGSDSTSQIPAGGRRKSDRIRRWAIRLGTIVLAFSSWRVSDLR